jgi:signal transduction histidine kinase
VLIFFASIASIEVSKGDLHIAAFWPSNGIALVALLRLRADRRLHAMAWALISAALLGANLLCGNPVAQSVVFTIGNLAEIAFAYAVMRGVRTPAPTDIQYSITLLLRRLLIAAMLAPAAGAIFGAVGLAALTGDNIAELWLQWWLPSSLGLLIVAPMGLLFTPEGATRLRGPGVIVEAALGLALIAAVFLAIVFAHRLAMLMFLTPILILAAIRHRAFGVMLVMTACTLAIVPVATQSAYSDIATLSTRLAITQAFLIVNGLVAFAAAAILDERDGLIRELDQQRNQAAATAQARLRLLMGLAHEIRTPLNAIQGCAELVASAGPVTERQTNLLDAVAGASRQLQTLASDLLETARAEHGALSVSPRAINAEEIIEAAVAELRAALDEGRRAIIHIDANVEIWADPLRFRQIATNFISNAIKHGAAHGPIAVQVRRAADYAALAVIDRGPGFAPGRERTAFEAFAAGASPATGVSAGVGLSLARQMVEAHGGSVRCVSSPFVETLLEARLPLAHASTVEPTAGDFDAVDPDSVF